MECAFQCELDSPHCTILLRSYSDILFDKLFLIYLHLNLLNFFSSCSSLNLILFEFMHNHIFDSLVCVCNLHDGCLDLLWCNSRVAAHQNSRRIWPQFGSYGRFHSRKLFLLFVNKLILEVESIIFIWWTSLSYHHQHGVAREPSIHSWFKYDTMSPSLSFNKLFLLWKYRFARWILSLESQTSSLISSKILSLAFPAWLTNILLNCFSAGFSQPSKLMLSKSDMSCTRWCTCS